MQEWGHSIIVIDETVKVTKKFLENDKRFLVGKSRSKHNPRWDDKEIYGRFTLYPTNNRYNFILLDQLNGTTYQVQWHNERDKRFVSRIY